MSMKTISTNSIVGESKCPTLASYVEKPPSASVANAWQIASNQPMPASFSDTAQAIVMSR